MTEVATLIKREYGKEDVLREVFCGVRSIGMKEFYSANSTDYRPELKLVLADYNGQRYRILRTYRAGQELELTLERAPEEEVDADG